jgi:hypothetical protein
MPAKPSFILLALCLVVAAFAASDNRFALQAERKKRGLGKQSIRDERSILLRAENGSAIRKTSSDRPLPAAQAAGKPPCLRHQPDENVP